MSIALHLPLNSTSLGQVSFSILREIYSRGIETVLFPIGDVDASTQQQDPTFFAWIQQSIQSAQKTHNRKNPIFKLWHLAGSLESFSEKQVLLSFYELDSPTQTEINIVNNNAKVLLSSNYAISAFNNLGCTNLEFIPLAFDSTHFNVDLNRPKDRTDIHFGLCGKLEPQRKRHLKALQAWVKQYGNKPGYFLNCAIFNKFLDPNVQSNIIGQALQGQRYWNLNFLPFMESNEAYNKFINNNDIILATSGGEGWGLPEFQSVAIGKHCVGINAHAYKDWMTDENSVLVNPNSKIPVYDGMFFHQGAEINQGNIFDWDENDFIKGMQEAESRLRKNPVNTAGLKLQAKFTYPKMVDSILQIMNNL